MIGPENLFLVLTSKLWKLFRFAQVFQRADNLFPLSNFPFWNISWFFISFALPQIEKPEILDTPLVESHDIVILNRFEGCIKINWERSRSHFFTFWFQIGMHIISKQSEIFVLWRTRNRIKNEPKSILEYFKPTLSSNFSSYFDFGPISRKMEVIKTIQKRFAIIGIISNQSSRLYPLNATNFTVFCLLVTNLTINLVYCLIEANGFQEYINSAFTCSTLLVGVMAFVTLIGEMAKVFEFFGALERTIQNRT